MDKNETDTPAPAGHNSEAGLPTVDQIVETLTADNAEALARTTELVVKGQKFLIIGNDVEDSAATQFMVSLRARWKQSEADRVAAKTPWDDRAGCVQSFFKTKILDVLGLGPSKAEEAFDPVTSENYGMGPRINRAQTIYKLAKAESERRLREAEAKRLREAEEKARLERLAAEKVLRDEEDRLRRLQQAVAEKARLEAMEASLAASRKRNEDSKAAAEIAAAAARKRSDEAAAAQKIEDERIATERAERDEANRLEENRLAEERAQAEESANVSLADLSRNRGEKGGTSSLTSFTNWRDINRDTLDYAALGPYFKDAHIETALKGYSDANKALVQTGIKTGKQPIKGVVFFLDAKSRGRA